MQSAFPRHPGALLLLLAGLPVLTAVRADDALVERTVQVPVALARVGIAAPPIAMTVTVTYRQQPRPGPLPFALLLHGRPADPQAFRRMGIQAYPANARWLAGLGFLVLVPTRIGYGQTGGPDPEFAGPCSGKDYRTALLALRTEAQQLLVGWPAVAQQEHLAPVDPTRGMVLGESFGAIGALALADGSLPGVRAVVNVAGGDGGRFDHPDQPCAEAAVGDLMHALGQSSQRPSLWLYSLNDRLWGQQAPQAWLARYRQGGGKASFLPLPPVPENGHFVFNRRPAFWQEPLRAFLQAHGLLSGAPLARLTGR